MMVVQLWSRVLCHIWTITLVCLSIAGRPATAQSCAATPIAIPIGNVTLPNNQVARGVKLQVGTPPQNLAFLPQLPNNNSFIFGTNGYCAMPGTTSQAACTTLRGGAFNPFASTSRQVAADGSYTPDVYTQTFQGPTKLSYITDTLTIDSNNSIAKLIMGMPLSGWGEQGYHPMMALGLGTGSTVMAALKSSGKVASNTFSMFWGLNGGSAAAQMDGSVVFGGYDAAKVTGKKFTQTIDLSQAACPSGLIITISDLVLNFPNGTDASLFSGAQSQAISACIVPDYPVLMTMPASPFFDNLRTLTNGKIDQRTLGLAYFANRYAASETPYAGDLTFKLQNGLSIRIPNDQLIVPDQTIDPTTGAIVANSTGPDIVINAIQEVNADDNSQLGRQFLSAAYLMVNYDAGLFSLWAANPTTASQLVAVDKTNADITASCSASTSAAAGSVTASPVSTATVVTSGTSSTSATSSVIHDQAPGPSIGVIVGIVVGAVAVLILFGVLLFWALRRRRNKTQAGTYPDPRSSMAMSYEKHGSHVPQEYQSTQDKPALWAAQNVELASVRDPVEAGHHSPHEGAFPNSRRPVNQIPPHYELP